MRRGGREAEGAGLLNLYTRKGIEGSNPSLSAEDQRASRILRLARVLRISHFAWSPECAGFVLNRLSNCHEVALLPSADASDRLC